MIDDMKKINNLLQSQFEHAARNSNAKYEEIEQSLHASVSDVKAKDKEITNLYRELEDLQEQLQKSKSLADSATDMNKSLEAELKLNERNHLNSSRENHEDVATNLKERQNLTAKAEQAESKHRGEMLAVKRNLEALALDKKKLEHDNVKLKSVVQQCHKSMEQMQKEFLELKLLSGDATARLNEKNNDTDALVNKKLAIELSKINAMNNETEKQLLDANVTIDALKRELQIAENRFSKLPPDANAAAAEKECEVPPKHDDISHVNIGAADTSSLLRMERDLRCKAEEIAAALAARAKSGFEKKDEEIAQLRMRLSSLTGGKEIGVRNSLNSGLDYLEDVHDLSLTDMKRERDEARNEAQEYKALAEDLHRVLYEQEHQTPAKMVPDNEASGRLSSKKSNEPDGHQSLWLVVNLPAKDILPSWGVAVKNQEMVENNLQCMINELLFLCVQLKQISSHPEQRLKTESHARHTANAFFATYFC